MNQIFIGFDSSNYGQELAYNVCERSIKKYNKTIIIHKLNKKDLEQKNIFRRIDNTGSTEFTYTRFLSPYLSNYQGWSLFCDSDFLWFCDPEELIKECIKKNEINNRAVYCVQHKYTECNAKEKMDGRKQEWYPRKNWSSLMIFNCSHPDIQNLNLENINTQTPKWLHRMEWTTEVGEIDKKYNYLVGYYNDGDYKALHYTDGGPWHPGYEKVEYGDLWLNELTYFEKFKMNYREKTEVLCVTSFNKKLYLEYAHRFLKTYSWPFDLLIYSEEDLIINNKNIKTLNILKCDTEFQTFINNNKNRKVKKFLYDGVRFSYKVFGIVHAGLNFKNYKYLIWIDADIIFKKTIDLINLEKYFIKKDCMMSYLGRINYHTESGFIIFDLQHKLTEKYLIEMRRMYLSNDIYKEKEQTDSHIWDVVRIRFEKKYQIQNYDIGKEYCKRKSYPIGHHILLDTPLFEYLDHLKGELRKKIGSSIY